MSCHAPPLKIAMKQGEIPLPSLGLIQSLNSTVLKNGMGLRLGNGISPSVFAVLRGGVWQAIPKSFLFFGEFLFLLVQN